MALELNLNIINIPSAKTAATYTVSKIDRSVLVTGSVDIAADGTGTINVDGQGVATNDWLFVMVDDFTGSNFSTAGSASTWVQVNGPTSTLSYTFTGSEYITIPPWTTTKGEIEFDFLVSDLSTSKGLLDQNHLSGYFALALTNGGMYCRMATDQGMEFAILNTSVVVGTQQHCKIVFELNVGMTIAVDGVTSSLGTLIGNSIEPLYQIGKINDGNLHSGGIKNLTLTDLITPSNSRNYTINDGWAVNPTIADSLGTGSTDGTAISFQETYWGDTIVVPLEVFNTFTIFNTQEIYA